MKKKFLHQFETKYIHYFDHTDLYNHCPLIFNTLIKNLLKGTITLICNQNI